MAKGLYEGRILGTESYTDKKTSKLVWKTNCAIGSTVISFAGAGFDDMCPVYVLGELRTFDNRTFMIDPKIYCRPEGSTLVGLAEAIVRADALGAK